MEGLKKNNRRNRRLFLGFCIAGLRDVFINGWRAEGYLR